MPSDLAIVASSSITLVATALDLSFSAALALFIRQSAVTIHQEMVTYCNWNTFSMGTGGLALNVRYRSISVRRIA